MKFFPCLVAVLLALVAVMWARLDVSREKPVSKTAICVPPYELEWLPWKPGLVESTRKEGKVVWLMFTADWDLTAKVNEHRVFLNQGVQDKLTEHRVVLIKADNTLRDPAIGRELKKYRDVAMLPTNLVFPGDPKAGALLLPEVIGPEDAIEALERAAGL